MPRNSLIHSVTDTQTPLVLSLIAQRPYRCTMAFVADSCTEFPINCYLCRQSFRHARDLSRHERAVHPLGFQCGCGRSYDTTYTLRRHSQRKGCFIYNLYSWALRGQTSSSSRPALPVRDPLAVPGSPVALGSTGLHRSGLLDNRPTGARPASLEAQVDDSDTEQSRRYANDSAPGRELRALVDEDPYGGESDRHARLARFQSVTISGHDGSNRLMNAGRADRSRSRPRRRESQ